MSIRLVLPLHPRTLRKLESIKSDVLHQLNDSPNIKLIEPVSFLEMIELEKYCAMVITDSGGVQKEAYFFKKPCVILGDETEWVEIVRTGSAVLTGSSYSKIVDGFDHLSNKSLDYPEIFGDGTASEFICNKIVEFVKQ